MIGLDTLNELNREAEIVRPCATRREVRPRRSSSPGNTHPWRRCRLAQGDLDDEVRAMAVKVIGYVQQYGQAPGVAGA